MSNYNYVAHACAYLNQDIGKLHFIYVRLYFEIYTSHFMNWDGGAIGGKHGQKSVRTLRLASGPFALCLCNVSALKPFVLA